MGMAKMSVGHLGVHLDAHPAEGVCSGIECNRALNLRYFKSDLAMVNFCAIVGCTNRGMRDKKSFYHLPAIILKEGEKTRELSENRRRCWLAGCY